MHGIRELELAKDSILSGSIYKISDNSPKKIYIKIKSQNIFKRSGSNKSQLGNKIQDNKVTILKN